MGSCDRLTLFSRLIHGSESGGHQGSPFQLIVHQGDKPLTTSVISFPGGLESRTPCVHAADRGEDLRSRQRHAGLISSLPKNEPVPIVRWDIMRGIGAANEAGKAIVTQLLNGQNPESIGPSDALALATRLPEDAMLIANNFHRFWNDPAVMQGVWNLRDSFKADGRALLMMASPGARLPEELAQDVLVLDQPLPRKMIWSRSFETRFNPRKSRNHRRRTCGGRLMP